MKNKKNSIIILVVLFLIGIFLYQSMSVNQNQNVVSFSEFTSLLQDKEIISATIEGENITFVTNLQQQFTTVKPQFYPEIISKLHENGVRFNIVSDSSNNLLFSILIQWLPMIVLVSIWIIFMRQMQGGSKIMSFGRIKPKTAPKDTSTITFADVAGIDEAKDELEEVVSFLKNPRKFQNLGGKVPHGVLLCGQPGTGKTLLARAVAGEAQAKFLSISGSDFVEMFVGVGAARVRDIFEQARSDSSCIIFIDEIDAVGRSRGSGLGGGNDEREQTLNQILVEMDGFQFNAGIIVIAATNRPDTLDPALTRPGRFDRTVIVPLPDKLGRLKILEIYTRKIKVINDLDLDTIARSTQGFTGADLENLVNEAALLAGRKAKEFVDKEDFEAARDKIMMGNERRSLTMTKDDLENTAYHEAGHALIAALSNQTDILHKVTIIPRGRALGLTMFLPKDNQVLHTKKKLLGMLEMIMGGRAAEELIYNHFTTGAQNDLKQATEYAHKMVCSWGMNEIIGPFYLSNTDQNVFLGQGNPQRRRTSQKMAMIVDKEVMSIINQAYKNTYNQLKKNIHILHELAKKLLQEETVSGEEVIKLLKISNS